MSPTKIFPAERSVSIPRPVGFDVFTLMRCMARNEPYPGEDDLAVKNAEALLATPPPSKVVTVHEETYYCPGCKCCCDCKDQFSPLSVDVSSPDPKDRESCFQPDKISPLSGNAASPDPNVSVPAMLHAPTWACLGCACCCVCIWMPFDWEGHSLERLHAAASACRGCRCCCKCRLVFNERNEPVGYWVTARKGKQKRNQNHGRQL